MTVAEIMAELEANGSQGIKNIFLKHGIKEPFFGVKVEFLKTIQKRVKIDNALAKGLFSTGNADAMYLAGLIADDKAMSREDLQQWGTQALSTNISEYTVPWVAAGSNYGYELAMQWITAAEEHIQAAGWATLSNLVALKPDNELDLPALSKLLQSVIQKIHTAPNRVKYTMNGFIIAVGGYVPALTEEAIAAAIKNGVVKVNMGQTSCKVPDAVTYIGKMKAKGQIGKKKKMVKC